MKKVIRKEKGRPGLVVGLEFDESEAVTKQAFKDEVNINNIVERYQTTGVVSHVNPRAPFYGDVSMITNYADSLAVVKRAEEMFAKLPSRARERFKNNPVEMISFLADPKNREEAIRLGVIDREPEAMPAGGPKAPVAPSGAVAPAPAAPDVPAA